MAARRRRHGASGSPVDRDRRGSADDVDVLIGTNTDDWRLWLIVSGAIAGITDDVLAGPVSTHGHQCLEAYGLDPRSRLHAYRARYPRAVPGDLLAAVQTDWWSGSPPSASPRHTRTPAPRAFPGAQTGTFMYEFAWGRPDSERSTPSRSPSSSTRPGATRHSSGRCSGRTAAGARADDALRLGGLRDDRGPGLAGLRRGPDRHDAPRHRLRRSSHDPRAWERAFWEDLR